MRSLLITLLSLILVGFQASLAKAQCGTVTFITQQDVDNFQTNHPGCTRIEGNLNIGNVNSDITNLDGLENITEVTQQLNISTADMLSNLKGLGNLQSVDNLRIWDNAGLVNLEGLESLTTITGVLTVKNNGNLENLKGLENVNTVGRVFINQNEYLRNLTGLDNLQRIQENANNIEADGSLFIIRNEKLEDLSALANLQYIDNVLSITSNEFIISLEGLENIEEQSIKELYIGGNLLLYHCDLENICTYISDDTRIVNVNNNEFGCNNIDQLIEACTTPVDTTVNSIYTPLSFDFEVFPNPNPGKELSVQLSETVDRVQVEIINAWGQVLNSSSLNQQSTLTIDLPEVSGFFWVLIRDERTSTIGYKKILRLP